MRTIISIIILATIFSVSMCGVASAVDDGFAADLDMPKIVINKTEPIYVNWMMRNNTDDKLTLLITPDPYYSRPAITYKLWVKSIRVTGTPVDVSTSGALTPAWFKEVPAHSNVCIWEMSLRTIFGAGIPTYLSPGLYRVSVNGSWEGVTEDGVTSYYAQTYFMVQ